MRTLLPLGLAGVLGLLVGCPNPKCEGSNCPVTDGGFKEPVCSQYASATFSSALGTCKDVSQRILELGSECDQKLAPCSGDDKAALGTLMQCYSGLSATPCQYDEEVPFQKALFACNDAFEKAASQECRGSLYSGSLNPQGALLVRRPDTDGGGALDLIVVADEDSFALSWSATQRGAVEKWSVQSENAVAERMAEVVVTPSSVTIYNEYDAGTGVKKGFWVLGLDSKDEVVKGAVGASDAGTVDAGAFCSGPLDCHISKVCNLGQCQVQPCQNSNICPAGYLCETTGSHTCIRQFGADGGMDAGAADAGASTSPRPFVSKKVSATTGIPKFSEENFVSPFSPRNGGDVVAIDSARQVIALQQEGQLWAHLTQNRGKTFAIGQIDSLGTDPKLAWVPGTGTLYACYNAGNGVRVRRSHDLGRNWGAPTEVADLANPQPTDGGVATRISDCDIAPWRDGRAIVVTVDGDQLVVRTITSALGVESTDVAFSSSPADGGINVVDPQHPAIATLPEDRVVHVGFTGSRMTEGGFLDSEPYGIFRGPTTGGSFKFAGNLTYLGGQATKQFNSNPQDWVTVVLDPRTKRALAAYTTIEPDRFGLPHTAVNVSFFYPTERWGLRGDMSVFVTKGVSDDYHLFPDRVIGEKWNAFSPSLAITPSGRIYLGMLAGPALAATGAPDYHAYVVPFDFEAASAEAQAKGWFLPPARKAGQTRAVAPQVGGTLPTWTSLAADSQISVYMIYAEGIGSGSEVPNRPIMVSRP